MKCPYNRRSETHIMAYSQRSAHDPEISCCVQEDVWTFEQQDCIKQQCGVWRDGRCCYAAVSFDNR